MLALVSAAPVAVLVLVAGLGTIPSATASIVVRAGLVPASTSVGVSTRLIVVV